MNMQNLFVFVHLEKFSLKEARAGWGLKNRLRDIFLNFCIGNIHGILIIFMWKNTWLWLQWNGGDLKICVRYILFCCEIYSGTLLFSENLFLKTEISTKIDKWHLYGYCLLCWPICWGISNLNACFNFRWL